MLTGIFHSQGAPMQTEDREIAPPQQFLECVGVSDPSIQVSDLKITLDNKLYTCITINLCFTSTVCHLFFFPQLPSARSQGVV